MTSFIAFIVAIDDVSWVVSVDAVVLNVFSIVCTVAWRRSTTFTTAGSVMLALAKS